MEMMYLDYKNIGRWFGVLDRQSQSYIAKACIKRNITFQEYILLLNLYDHEGINQEDIAAIMLVDKAVVARNIKLLEEKGLVERVTSDKDRRIKQLFLTEDGKKEEPFIRSVLENWINYLSEGLEPEKVKIILEGLKYLSNKALRIEAGKN